MPHRQRTPLPLAASRRAPVTGWHAAAMASLLAAAMLVCSTAGCSSEPEVTVVWRARTTASGFDLSRNQGPWQPFWPMGVNFGLALPGHSPGEFLVTRAQLRRWFAVTAESGATTIRTYTNQSPLFYEELRRYNLAHEDNPLFLLQGIWIKEPEGYGPDYLSDATRTWVQDEINKVVRSVHGDIQIPPGSPARPNNWGRAHGDYTADVSPWLLGWLFGRELEPYSIESTLARHPKATVDHKGRYLSIAGENPLEAWVVSNLDRIVSLERDRYHTQHPIGFSNWPTLDPITHWTEPKIPISAEDTYQIDLEPITAAAGFSAGVFMSYHAYPYYPDFILYQPEYQDGKDAQGPFPYISYLAALQKHHKNHAVIIAEVGHPSSLGNGHQTPSGQDHGGFSEQAQGPAVLRSVGGIVAAGLHGAMVFSIIDEWFKRAWVVERIETPADRRKLWHNVMNPEQNFGLIAMHAGPASKRIVLDGTDEHWGAPDQTSPTATAALSGSTAITGRLRDLTVRHDAAYLYVRARLTVPSGGIDWQKVDVVFAFDTLDPARGDGRLDPAGKIRFGRRVEHILRIQNASDAELRVDRPFDLYGLWHRLREPWQKYRTTANDGGVFNLMRTLTNENYDAKDQKTGKTVRLGKRLIQETGRLVVGDERTNSLTTVAMNAETGLIEVRVPWNLLQITDPSSRQIVDDDGKGGGKTVSTSTMKAIAVAAVLVIGADEQETTWADSIPVAQKTSTGYGLPAAGWVEHSWPGWDKTPAFHERTKPIVGALKAGLPSLLPASAKVPGP